MLRGIIGGLAVTIVAHAESLAAASGYARKSNDVVDPNQEMIGLGVANSGRVSPKAYHGPACLPGRDQHRRTHRMDIVAVESCCDLDLITPEGAASWR